MVVKAKDMRIRIGTAAAETLLEQCSSLCTTCTAEPPSNKHGTNFDDGDDP